MGRETRVIPVGLAGASYEVRVGAGVLGEVGVESRRVLPRARRAMLVVDANLPRETVERARGSLERSGFATTEWAITATEPLKSMGTVEGILERATMARLERGEPIVALGGGVVGDVAGFAAAVYRRGVPVIQCPTTLLSMVDASVGGKTGVNQVVGGAGGAVLKKNMIGAFHQPALVVCDVESLRSLALREMRSGLAECVKHAILSPDWGDDGLLRWMEERATRLIDGGAEMTIELVARNVAIKARVVGADEREEREDHRGRMVLNMGHTVGHAIEPLGVRAVYAADDSGEAAAGEGLLHGEAVALGMIAETVMAERCGAAPVGTRAAVERLLMATGLPTRVSGLPTTESIIDGMRDDKKTKDGAIRIVVPTSAGSLRGSGPVCAVVKVVDPAVLAAGIDAIRA